jgi:dihydrofolate reductase
MPRIVVSEFLTLDGVMQAPGDPNEDRNGDAYRLMVHPLVLGSGKRLFREGASLTRLRLVDSKPTTTGVLILTYEPASA